MSESMNKVNMALHCLYKLVTIVGTFNQKEKELFCSYIEYLDKKSECENLVKELKENQQLTLFQKKKEAR